MGNMLQRSKSVRLLLVTALLVGSGLAQNLLVAQPLATLSIPMPVLPGAMVASDLDADGDDDFVLSESTGLVILRNQGGTFVRELLATGSNTGSGFVIAQDLDLDGNTDLCISVPMFGFSSTIRIWWGDGTGQFPTASPTDLTVPSDFAGSNAVAADVDGDLDVDLMFATTPSFGVSGGMMLRNQGSRTFAVAPANQYPTASSGNATPSAVDVDGDGALDIVLVSANARSRLYWNNGGNFAEASLAQFPLIESSHRGLAAADFDGDGDLDLVLGGDADEGVLLRTNGPRQLVLDVAPATDIRSLAVVAADADGDGDSDLHVFHRYQDQQRSNDGSGQFATTAWFAGIDDVAVVSAADLDQDGDVDWVRIGKANGFGSSSMPLAVSAAYATVPGQYQYVGGSRLPISTGAVRSRPSGDIDGDQRPDLILQVGEPQGSNPAATMQFVTPTAEGQFVYRWASRIGAVDNGFFADLSGDGRDEYIVYGQTTGYFANDAGVLATTLTPLPTPTFAPISAGVGADIDDDGDIDLLLTMTVSGYQLLRVLVNQGGTFVDETATRAVGPPIDGDYPRVFAADFDGDLDLDVWVHTADQEHIWHNQGGVLSFVPAGVPINGWGGRYATIGDLDGDGHVDLRSGRRILRNDGTGMFQSLPLIAPTTPGIDLLRFAVDLDDDGDLDLIGSGLTIWNNGSGQFTVANNVQPIQIGVTNVVDVDADGDPDVIASISNQPVLLLNQLRQLRLEGQARVGGSVDLRYSMQPGSVPQPVFFWLAVSFATVAPVFVPDLGWVQIDPTQLSVVGPFALPASGGDLLHQEPVPNIPSLLGTLFAVQPVELRGGRLRTGNLVKTLLDR